MARTSRWTISVTTAWIMTSLVALAAATPAVTFPFNSQVPLVARKNQPYNYQLSKSTFDPQDGLEYSLIQQPSWLSIDANRTLLGTPGDGDVGSTTFTIVATDGSGDARMQCVLVVASDPAPQLQGGLAQQLSAEVNLTSSTPPIVSLTPGTHFNFEFRQDSFIDIVQRKLYYYATLSNHTPLPSWLLFDSGSLSFSGIAPQLSAFPQSWQIALIASDYEGFAGASASFTVVISNSQLTIVPNVQVIHAQLGESLNSSLLGTVYLNGQKLGESDIKSASATLPDWATFDAKSLTISGSPTQNGTQNGSVIVVDTQGNTAQTTLEFVVGDDSSVFAGDIGTVTAVAGQQLDYEIPTSVISESDVALSLTAPSDASWLSLDPSAHVIEGLAPTDAAGQTFQATLVAKASSLPDAQTQTFTVAVASANSSSTGAALSAAGVSGSGLSGGEIAAIVICSILGTLILLALIMFCCRRRRRHESYVRDTPSPTKKRLISGPYKYKPSDTITVTTLVHADVEKARDAAEPADEDAPPQIALEIPAPNVSSARLGARASGLSQVSSIGNGEDAIRRDANIPEWGQDNIALQKPHDSFSIPVAMAHGSRHIRSLSPTKRALLRAQEKRNTKQSIGLGIDTTGDSSSPQMSRSKKSGRVKKKASSAGLSATLDRSSCASFSTQATSLLSTRPSDFPRPPTQSTISGGSRSIPTLSMIDADKRRSIRLLRRSDSINDSRPIELRRESFIRARASTSLQSPLFAHGSRNPLEARGRGSSSEVSSSILDRWRSRRQMQRSTYSQSSLMSRTESDCRRLSQRVRSVFAPNFPRVISGSEYEDDLVEEDDKDDEWEDITPAQSRHQSTNHVPDFAAELSKPRHQRTWVLPGEASPTPPRIVQSRHGSSSRKSDSEPRARWKQRVARGDRSSSPLPHPVAGINEEEASPRIPSKSPKRRLSYINEPLGLVSKDSLSRAGADRPRLGDTKTSRPQSVENVDRLSSLKAETMDAQGGSEMLFEYDDSDDATRGTGLTGPDRTAPKTASGTQKSAVSGKAFI